MLGTVKGFALLRCGFAPSGDGACAWRGLVVSGRGTSRKIAAAWRRTRNMQRFNVDIE